MTHDELLAEIKLYGCECCHNPHINALLAVVELHKQILETPLPPEPKWDGYQDYDWANSGGIELTHAKALHTLAEQTMQAIEKELK